MKVKFIRNTVAAKEFVKIGDVCDLNESEARFLVLIGKAEMYVEEEPTQKIEEKPAAEVAAEPAPKRRKKKGEE